jgi:hydroxyacylglutathione hydrolase
MMEIEPILAFSDNYVWLITGSETNRAVVVDPGDAAPVLEQLDSRGLTLEAVLVTHNHADHVAGIEQLVDRHTAPVYGSRKEEVAGLTHPVAAGERLTFPGVGLELSVLETPGHTAGHVCYQGQGVVFTGDTLFAGGCGRLFGGTAEQMCRSLSRLAQLPEATQVYCAHEYKLNNLRFALAVEPGNQDLLARQAEAETFQASHRPTVPSSLELEKRTNPFLRCGVPGVKAAAEKRAGKPLGDPVQVFATLRAWKDSF